MNDVLRLACECSLLLVCGSTLLLGLGCAAVAACRSPVHRQRLAELTVGGFLIWLVLTLVPMPRLASPWFGRNDDAPAKIDIAASSAPVVEMLPVESELISELLPQVDPFSSIPPPQETSEWALPGDTAAWPSALDEAPPSAVTIAPQELGSPITAAAATSSKMSAPPIIAIVVGTYLIGSAVCAALLLVGYVVLLWIRATGKQPPTWLNTDYQELSSKAHAPAAELLVNHRCSRPISWGLLWPAIVLPDRLCRQVNRTLVGAILLHELGHVARRDAWGNLLFCIVTPLLYCHPLFWWLRREWNLAAELVADDWAAWQTGKDAYVEELMDLARTSPASGLPFVGATAVFSSPSQFYRRMQMLLTREQPLNTKTSVVWQLASVAVAALGIALASSLGGARPTIAQDKPAAPAPALPEERLPAAELPAIDLFSPSAPEPPTPPRPDLPPQPKVPEIPPRNPAPPADVEGPAPRALPDPLARNATVTRPETPEAVLQELRAEQAQLEARLHALQARLKELGADPAITADSAGTVARLPVNAKGLIEMTRVDKDGTLWRETWTADKKGQPAKLMSRTATGELPAKITTEPRSDGTALKTYEGELWDGNVLKAVQNKDGTITVHVYDSATGKVIEMRRDQSRSKGSKSRNNALPSIPLDNDDLSLPPATSTADSKAKPSVGVLPPDSRPYLEDPSPATGTLPVIPPSTPPVSTSAAEPTTTRVPERAPTSSSYRELDLVSLATSYADALSNLESAQAKLADIEATEAKVSGTIPKQEITSAQLAIGAAKRKEQLLQRIAKVALEGVSKELEHAVELHKAGVIPASGLEEKRTRTEILKQILSTQSDIAPDGSPSSSNKLDPETGLQRK